MELSRNLIVDSVGRLGPAAAHAVEASCPVADAVALMRREGVGCVVVTRSGVLVGIFTERDLLTRVLAVGGPLSAPVADVMTPSPVTVSPSDSVHAAVQKMQDGGYRHLPVIDEAGRPVGMLSAKRIVRYIVSHVPAVVYAQPPGPPAPSTPPVRFGG